MTGKDDFKRGAQRPPNRGAGTRPVGEARQPAGPADKPERIAKRLARSGVASRRDAEEMIAAGRVSVNGKILDSPALNVSRGDVILVDGAPIPERERTRLFLFHKPAGTMTTNRDPEGRKTVFDILPKNLPRLVTVGRLDFSTEGLLLMTNDGGLARVLELPSTGWLRRYRVRVHGNVNQEALDGLKQGTAVEGVFYGAIDATLDRKQGSNAWLTMALKEGKNREIRNVLGALGLEVTRLIRISYGPFQLGELPEGAIVELKGRTLRDQLGPRLIAEAGADFEAEIRTPFSNKPQADKQPADKPAGQREPRGEGKDFREKGLERLQTSKKGFEGRGARDGSRDPARPSRNGEKSARFGDKAARAGTKARNDKPKSDGNKRPFEPPRNRASNVWMAPGARPVSNKKKIEREAAENADGRKRDPKTTRSDRRSDRPKGRGSADRRR